MTKISPATDDRWAVSTRTHGEVLTAGVTLPFIELALLGIPQGFTPVEIQSWLRDLAGVAIETSKSDQRSRPIPQLLHHALTGLLFSQTELWSHTGQSLPCTAVFVDGPNGTAFGWVGRARVMLLVNGEPYEPQWVIVRDEAGHEAMSAMLPPESHVLMTLEYWPQGEDGTQAPVSVDAEVGHAHALRYPGQQGEAAAAAPAETSDTVDVPPVMEPATAAGRAAALPPPPDSLPTQQPGLAPDPSSVALDRPDAAQSLPSTYHPSARTFAIPPVPTRGEAAPDVSGEAPSPVWSPDPAGPAAQSTHEEAGSDPRHPVGRWLSRLMSFGRHEEPAGGPTHAAPVSSYDAMLSPASPGGSTPSPARPPAPRSAEPQPPAEPPAPADISEPHALPDTAGLVPPRAPSVAAPARSGGLAPAGLREILGKGQQSKPPLKESAQVASAPPTSTKSEPAPPPEPLITEELPSPGTPLYPLLEVTTTGPIPPGPIQIEREPIGADESFAIPKLPPLGSPKPVRAPAPDPFVARGTPPASPAATPPASPTLRAPGMRVAQSGVPEPAVPEPPADFLAEFAASMHGEPAAEPTAITEPAPPSEPASARPAEPPPPVAQAPPPQPPIAQALPPLGPPALPPTLRGTAPVARPVVPPVAGRPLVSPPTLAPAPAPPPPAQLRPPVQPPAAATPPLRRPAVPPARVPLPDAPVLRTPSPPDPAQLAADDVAALMRELPLPTPSAEMARPVFPAAAAPAAIPAEPAPATTDEVPEGMLVATRSRPRPPGARSKLASWPAPEELESRGTPPWRRPWLIATFVAVLFGIGWLVGHSQAPDNDIHATPFTRLLRTVGLGGARFTASVDTDPPGAWIAVDGKDVGRRTPTTMELVPGDHKLTLSMPDLGDVQVVVKGGPGQKVKVNEALNGSLDVTAVDPSLPVKMTLDGAPAGWLPVHVEKLPPGLHEVQFNGPNMPPWGQNVSVNIRQTATLVARPMMSPATGVVEIQASNNDDSGTAPLSGADVFVDGDLRGTTPLTLELPRGPHSLRVSYRSDTAPIQVIDLPGGNRRFASFQFGLDSDLPPLRLQGTYASLAGRKTVSVVASLDGLDVRDVRDAWLHVRSPEGLWRRYEMSVLRGARGAMLTSVFPSGMFDAQGRVTWYASAATAQGDEFYTEMQRSSR